MRWPVALAALAIALAGCTPAPAPHDDPVALPQELAWRYAQTCFGDTGSSGEIRISWGDGPATVRFDHAPTPAEQAAAEAIQKCLDAFRYEPPQSYDYVSSYERAQLYDWYLRATVPCLAGKGIDLEPVPRSAFFDPADRPWNPYTGMDQLPFDQLIALYQACPPVPGYLQSRHEQDPGGYFAGG